MKTPEVIADRPHRRFNPLTGDWILVSPHRTKRPWKGKVEPQHLEPRPQYDPTCYLCPGNKRANGTVNPKYTGTYVFDNDFSALLPDVEPIEPGDHPFLRQELIRGICRVVCFSPRHDLTLPQMNLGEIRGIIEVWSEETVQLGRVFEWVQIFENKGEIMGCSNPHPHCQIWASSSLPNEPTKEDLRQRTYWRRNNKPLLIDYLRFEKKQGRRVIGENDHWIFVTPFWAIWPFETLLIPKRHVLRLPDLKTAERDALAEILKNLLIRYDNLFQTSFPYTMGWHGAPFTRGDLSHWQLHAHFYPPLLRSATVKKFMVGYEMLSEPQRDITPEQAADRLKEVSDVNFTH